MFAEQTILIINSTCIACLVIMMIIMIAATRMKGGTGWAVLISVSTTVPVYLSNVMWAVDSEHYLISLCVAMTLNLTCFPALWLFVRSQFDKSFRLRWYSLIHLLPAVISFISICIFYVPLLTGESVIDREYLVSNETPPAVLNDVFLFSQFFIYFTAIFFYIRKRQQFFRDNYSDSDYFTLRWIPSFLVVFFILFFIAFIGYLINPWNNAVLIPILNTVGIAYLVYIVVYHSTQAYINRLPDIPQEKDRSQAKEPPMSAGEMKEVCDKVIDYLKSSQAYLQQDLSLAILVRETGIPQKTLSRSINGYLKRNFFDLVNEMRVEEAKRRLLELKTDGYKIDSIYEECGFRTRSTFFIAFKKVEGETPAHWLETVKKGRN